jgi:peroxiredoxin
LIHFFERTLIMTTLSTQLQSVTAHVKSQAPAEVVATMEAATALLVASGQLSKALKAGDRFPAFELPGANGLAVSSTSLLAQGALVVSFYRGSWCPYCNLELAALQAQLGSIHAEDAQLVAISPQTPDQSLSTAEKNALQFPVLSDGGNALARQLGIVFTVPENLRPIYQAFGIDLQAHNGDTSFELPVPATYVVGSDGIIIRAWINADYRERAEPADVLNALQNIVVTV